VKPLHESDENLVVIATSVLLFKRSLELRSIAEGCAPDRWALDRTRAAIVRSHRAMLP
jgi:hypothetical protein